MWIWELDHKESWAWKKWCFWTVMLEKTLENPLDSKEIKLVNPKGYQLWSFIERTDAEAESPILATWYEELTQWKRPWCWKWRQEEKGMTECEVVGWHHRINGHEFEQLQELIQWCYLTILSSVAPFSSCLQSFPASFSNELTLCIRWPKYGSFSFSFDNNPSSEYSGLISFEIGLVSFRSSLYK